MHALVAAGFFNETLDLRPEYLAEFEHWFIVNGFQVDMAGGKNNRIGGFNRVRNTITSGAVTNFSLCGGVDKYVFSAPLDGTDSVGLATLSLRIRNWWKPEEKRYARDKRKCLNSAARSGTLFKPLTTNLRPSSAILKKAYGKPVSKGFHVDYIKEIQLGGCPLCPRNLRAMPARVSLRFGA